MLLDPPTRTNLLLLEDAEEFWLKGEGEIIDFVNEDRPSGGAFKVSVMPSHRPCKRPSFVPEQLALQQGCRKSGTVERDKWPVAARTARMKCPGDQLLSGPAFSLHENGVVARCNQLHGLHELAHRGRIADEDLALETLESPAAAVRFHPAPGGVGGCDRAC